jgi:hypothetical protein
MVDMAYARTSSWRWSGVLNAIEYHLHYRSLYLSHSLSLSLSLSRARARALSLSLSLSLSLYLCTHVHSHTNTVLREEVGVGTKEMTTRGGEMKLPSSQSEAPHVE